MTEGRVNQARSILLTARDVLRDRLADRVVEGRDEIIGDASGESYMSEVETLHEQLGLKLLQVSQMLECLPSRETASEGNEAVDAIGPPTGASAFARFVEHVDADEMDLAAEILARLLSLESDRARQCADHFRQRAVGDTGFISASMGLRSALIEQRVNDCLEQLQLSFGLQGPDLVHAFESLRRNVTV